ncbi:MAG: FmdE family protein [Dehalococcoidia bacterium]|nr:FmdE family protein [Dehalococcoidia bacterium]
MNTFQQDLDNAIAYHGHLCAGQILGVRMARAALAHLNSIEPESSPDLVVFVECDRCLADAIGIVTGCKIGRRTLKWMDYGKSAATFVNTKTKTACRVVLNKHFFAPEGADLLVYFASIPDAELLTINMVEVHLNPEDMPGKPLMAVTCQKCGEEVTDKRHVEVDGTILCKSCAYGGYYRNAT